MIDVPLHKYSSFILSSIFQIVQYVSKFLQIKLMQIKKTQITPSPPPSPVLRPSLNQKNITEKLILQLEGFTLDEGSNSGQEREADQVQKEKELEMQEEEQVEEEEKLEEGKRSYKEFMDDTGPQHTIAKVLTRLNPKPRKIVSK